MGRYDANLYPTMDVWQLKIQVYREDGGHLPTTSHEGGKTVVCGRRVMAENKASVMQAKTPLSDPWLTTCHLGKNVYSSSSFLVHVCFGC